MIITSEITMDVALPGAAPVVHAVQNDKYSRKIIFGLYKNGAEWEIPEGTTAIVHYQKPDGTGGSYDTLPDGSSAWSIMGKSVHVQLAPQVCTVAGTVRLAVSLLSGDAQLSTFSVKILVQARPGAALTSEDYYNVPSFVAASGWGANMYLGTDENGNVVAKDAPTGGGGGSVSVTVEEVLAAMPSVTAIDFTNFLNGSYTETIDGVATERYVYFTDRGMIIDGVAVTFPAEAEATT